MANLTYVVAPLANESDAAAAHVQPRTHPVALLRRPRDRWCRVQRKAADARERVADDLGLQLELPLVKDVREHVAAAAPVGDGIAPIGRRGYNLDGLRKQHAFSRSLHARAHALARYRAPDEHDPAVVPREHAAAGGRLFYVED